MNKRILKTVVFELDSVNELNTKEKLLVHKAKQAAKNAYSPYSKFCVGAAILLSNGKILTGNNQENAAYPSGLCAERIVLFYANSKYPDIPVKAIAITGFSSGDYINEPIPPCGACRQVLLETENRFEQPIKVIMAGKEKIKFINNVKELLPIYFDKSFL